MASLNLGRRAGRRTPLASAQFRAVIGASLLIMMGFGLIVPALPLFARRFGVEEAGIGLVLTVFAAWRLLGSFVAGSLIDRFGERRITGIGMVVVGLSSLAAGAAPTYTWLIALRGAGGVGSAFFLGGLMAYLIGSVAAEERGRAMGVFQAVAGVGILVGPVLGGMLIAAADERAPLFVYGAICLLCTPLMLRAIGSVRIPADALTEAPSLQENVSVPAPHLPAWRRLRPLLANRTYHAALAVAALGFLVVSALQTLVPVLWKETLGMSEASLGVPFAVSALAGLLVVWHAGALSDRRGRKFALVPAVAVEALAMVALAFAASPLVLVASLGMFGLASGYARPAPSAMVGDVAPPDARGIAVSGYRIAQDVGSLVGPILTGVIAERAGYGPAFLTLGAIAAVVLLLTLSADETAPARVAGTG